MSVFDQYHEDFSGDGVQCKFCNTSGLVWEDNGSGFRLYNVNHEKHICTGRNKPTPDDFDAI